MKILYTNFHAGPGLGGHNTYIAALVQALSTKHDVTVAVPASSSLFDTAKAMSGVQAYAQNYPTRVGPMLVALGSLWRLLHERQFDIVHVNGSSDHRLVALACLFLKRPPRIVFTKHNDIPVKPLGATIRARLGTDHVIAVCKHVANRLATSPYQNVGISTVLNGVDINHYQPGSEEYKAAMRLQYFGPGVQGKIVLGSNAGTDDYKGWLDLVRALAKLPPDMASLFHVALAGNPLSDAAIKEIDALGMANRLSYVGSLKDVRPFLISLDLGFVLSYRVETISFACREMMASGKPVIVSRYAGLPENIDHGQDGWVMPPQDPSSLSGLLKDLANGVYDIAAMGQAARAKSVSEFGVDAFVSATEHVYQATLQGREA